MIEYLIIFLIILLLIILSIIMNFPLITFDVFSKFINNDIVFLRKSDTDKDRIGLFVLKELDEGEEVIKYLDKNNLISYFGSCVVELTNEKKTNCVLRKKSDGYYLVSNKKILKGEELIIKRLN